MARILIASDSTDAVAEVYPDIDGEGHAAADCHVCPWATDPDRRDTLHDVIEEAGIHIDIKHRAPRRTP